MQLAHHHSIAVEQLVAIGFDRDQAERLAERLSEPALVIDDNLPITIEPAPAPS